MTPEQERFLNQCPTWARREGIDSLAEWQICESLMPLPWSVRYDKLAHLKFRIVQILDLWDAMAEEGYKDVDTIPDNGDATGAEREETGSDREALA